MRILLFLFTIIISLGINQTLANNAKYENVLVQSIRLEDGLSHSNVNEVIEDQEGFIWFGTDDGLCRYNGTNIKVFKHDSEDSMSVSGHEIYTLFEDSKRRLWVGTYSAGLNLYDKVTGTFKNIHPKEGDTTSISHESILSIVEDKDGFLWIGTRSGLNKFDPETLTSQRFYVENTLSNFHGKAIRALGIQEKTIFAGTDHGIFTFDTENNQMSYLGNEFLSKKLWKFEINDIAVNGDSVWFATNHGAYLYTKSNNGFESYLTSADKNSISSDLILTIEPQENGTIWFGSDGNGISILEPSTGIWNVLNTRKDHSIEKTSAQSIYDDGNRIWITTVLDGVKVLHKSSLKFHSMYDFHPDIMKYGKNAILAFEEDEEGNIWIGTDGSGMYKYNPTSRNVTSFTHNPKNPRSISSNVVKSLYIDENGDLYVGTYAGGLNILRKGKNTFEHYLSNPDDASTVSNDNVWALHQDQSGTLWVGTLGGLNTFDKTNRTFKRYLNEANNNNSYISATNFNIFEDSNGNVWFASQDGICHYNSETDDFSPFFPKEYGLEDNFVNDIFEDKNKNLWFITYTGIFQFNNQEKKLNALTTFNNQIKESVQTVLVDEQNNFWVSSNFGLYKIDLKDTSVIHFEESDGLQKREFHMGAKFIDSKGNFFFGGQAGLNYFKPDEITYFDKIPDIVLTELRLFLKPVNSFDDNNVLFGDLHFQDKLTFKYKQNFISLAYGTMDFNVKKSVSFKYKLEGFDETWNSVENMNLATYTRIPPGEYTFKIKSASRDGVWNEKEKSLQIEVIPPFWLTWWFKTLIVLLVIGIIWYIFHVRAKFDRKQKAILQDMVDSRTKDLVKMVKLLREKSTEISETGDALNTKARTLSNDAQSQIQIGQDIQTEIDLVTEHAQNNDKNARSTNEISQNIEKQLSDIKTATEENIIIIKQITDSVKVLDEIFKKTHILSLNASVEAARTNDSSNGFSIIADEMRKLSYKSDEASKQIYDAAQKGADMTENVGRLVQDFVPEIHKSAELIKEISDSSEKQNKSIHNINQTLRSFFKNSDKNSEASQNIHKVSSNLNHLGKYLKEIVDSLKV